MPPVVARARWARAAGRFARRPAGRGAGGEDDEHDEEARQDAFHGRIDARRRRAVPRNCGENETDAPRRRSWSSHSPPSPCRPSRWRTAPQRPRRRFPTSSCSWSFDPLRADGDHRDRGRLPVGHAAGQSSASGEPAAAVSDAGCSWPAWARLASRSCRRSRPTRAASSASTWCSTCSSSWSPRPCCWRARRSR